MKSPCAIAGAVLLVLAAGLVLAQSAPQGPGEVPAPGDPEVFGLFLQYQDSLVEQIEKEKARDAATAQNMQGGAAAMLKLSPTDFQKINPFYRTMESQLDVLLAEAQAYSAETRAKGALPDPEKVAGFEARRKGIVVAAREGLKAALSPEAWAALSVYIDGQFRAGVRKVSVKSR